MPIKPTPYKQVCVKCDWSLVFAPMSDVVFFPDGPPKKRCPKCGAEIVHKSLSYWDRLKIMKSSKHLRFK